ncbi:18856_t:CDS:2, partial [Gigaspora rosea]
RQTCEREAQERERNEQQQEPNQYAQLRQAHEQETRELEPSLESIVQFNRSEQERVECEKDKHKRKNATNTPSKRSIAQRARRKRERIKRARIQLDTFEILSQARQNSVSETDLAIYLHFNAATDQRRYNLPTINKIAIILPSDDFQIVFDEFGQHAEDQSNAPHFTQMDFYSFRLFLRHAEFSTILR